MILENKTVVYNPEAKVVIGEFEAGVDLYPAIGCETFEGTTHELLTENPGYSLIKQED